MADITLTEDAVAIMSSGSADFKPVLQVADIRLVNAPNQNTERYRIVLSDGKFLQQGMLATQWNEMVKSQKLRRGSVIQLIEFVCNPIQNRM